MVTGKATVRALPDIMRPAQTATTRGLSGKEISTTERVIAGREVVKFVTVKLKAATVTVANMTAAAILH